MTTRMHFLKLGAMLTLCLVCSRAAAGQGNPAAGLEGNLQPEPDGTVATLNATDGPIVDGEFASWMAEALTKEVGINRISNVKDAKFLFQECFGGGMLYRVKLILDAYGVSFAGGSASAFNQVSSGPAIRGMDFWTQTVVTQVNNSPDGNFVDQLNNAALIDRVANPRETPQVTWGGSSGRSITLKDPKAASHHAILFSGFSKRDDNRHYRDIENMHAALTTAWGSSDDIEVLFGDGVHQPDGSFLNPNLNAKPATKQNLHDILLEVSKRLNPNEEFFFYATDHGGSATASPFAPVGSFEWGLYQGQIYAARQLGATPTFTVSYEAPPATSETPLFKIDGQAVAPLPTKKNSVSFSPNPYLLHQGMSLTTDPRTPFQVTFSADLVDTDPPPSPGDPVSLSVSGPTTIYTSGAPKTYANYGSIVTFADGEIETIPVFNANWELSTRAPGISIERFTGLLTVGAISSPMTITIHSAWKDAPGGTTVTADQTVNIFPGPPPALTVSCPANTAVFGVPYSSAAEANGGVPPYSYWIILGALPGGLNMSATNGAVTGTPNGLGHTFVVGVTDSLGSTASTGCFINVTSR